MKILNLSLGFQMPPQIEAIPFEAFTFNGGEPHIKLGALPSDREEEILIAQRVTNSEAFLQLLMATDALRRARFRKISAWLPYFPAARQDRMMVPGEPLSVKVYAQIINAQAYERVLVFDPHSDVTPALLDRVQVTTNLPFVQKALQQLDNQSLCLVAPDAGATKKTHKLAQQLGGMEVVACEKIRDVKTGQLSGFSVFSDDLKGKDCLITDDICDGGGTFLGIAEALRKKGAGRVYLAVSHGIFSHGFEKLEAALDGIFTTDSFKHIEHPSVRQIALADVFETIFEQ
ncbi:MAG: ribose-phosphate pyrophosphokinase [Saprospiraceae bacterium]|nr:ribose-phosphate pyrophosphokinase [Saprospiraceae bacterium]